MNIQGLKRSLSASSLDLIVLDLMLCMCRGMADRLATLWQGSGEVEVPLWQEPVNIQGLKRSPLAPSLDPAALDYLLCNALKVSCA